jgi:hypothetical protein
MTSISEISRTDCTLAVDLRAALVDAGATVELAVSSSGPEDYDLSERAVAIYDHQGREVATAALAAEGNRYSTGSITFAAPAVAAATIYRAELLLDTDDAAAHEAAPVEFTITTKPHSARVNVWGVPATATAGERLGFRVGVKCSSACDLSGQTVEIVNARGTRVASGKLGADHWPGTEGLHYVELRVPAPKKAGPHSWKARIAATGGELPHAEGTATFGFNVVPSPDFDVIVEAIDSDGMTPIANARVVMHPYRATTDASGVARLRVAKGEYRMQIAGTKYLSVSHGLNVTGHVALRTEMLREPPPRSPDDDY